MRASWLLRGGFFVLLGVTVALAWPAAPAEAGPWDTYGCGCGGGYGGGWGGGWSGRRYPTGWRRGYGTGGGCGGWGNGGFYDALHQRRFIAHGSAYYLLRRHLHRIHVQPNHYHSRSFWFRRWGCALGDAATTPVLGHTCCGTDQPFNECKVTMAALGTDEIPAVDTLKLTREDRLLRGMERFHRGIYDEALEDFRGALKADEKDARARMGVLMCALMEKDWKGVAKEVKTLYGLGELSGADRLDLESCFTDPKRFTNVRDGLSEMTKYNFHQVDAQLAAGWAWVMTGDLEKAETHLNGALRFDKKNAVAKHLLATMNDAEPEEADEPDLDPAMPSDEARPTPGWRDRPMPNLAAMQE